MRTSVALGLVAGFLATPVGLAHPGAMQHDVCDPVPATPDTVTQVSAADARAVHGHCFTCHWFQSFRTSFTAWTPVVLDDAPSDGVLPAVRSIPSEAVALHLASRAPPIA